MRSCLTNWKTGQSTPTPDDLHTFTLDNITYISSKCGKTYTKENFVKTQRQRGPVKYEGPTLEGGYQDTQYLYLHCRMVIVIVSAPARAPEFIQINKHHPPRSS